MDYDLSKHASDVLVQRGIQITWLERAISAPALIESSEEDTTLESRFVRIPEFEGRVLRVVVNKQVAPIRIVSAYFDRTMKGKL